MQVNVPGTLQDLNSLVNRIGELIEWDKLAKQERKPHVPPAFQPANHLTDDVRSLYSLFLSLSLSVHDVLNREDWDFTSQQRQRWRRRLQVLEKRVHDLEITDRFIKG